jgi:hypothetical protein
MLVVTAVSSINTRWAGSRKPCSRIQRRRARATSARLRSAARRLFFDGDAMTGEEAASTARKIYDHLYKKSSTGFELDNWIDPGRLW